MSAPGGFVTAIRRGAISGLVFVLLVAAAVAVYVATGNRLPGQGRAEEGRVLIIGALPDENGDLVATVIADAQVSDTAQSVRSIDPSAAVTVVGTSYHHLRDSYAFGGGAALAEAYARVGGGEPLPFIDLGPDAMEAAITAAGGVELDLPEEMNVFDGERLYTFPQGPITANTDEFRAILNGSAYLGVASRSSILSQASKRVAELAAGYPGGLAAAVDAGTVSTDMHAEDAGAFVTRVTQAR